MTAPSAWLLALETGAPDVVACYDAIDEGRRASVRHAIRARAGIGSHDTAIQLGVVAEAFIEVVSGLPDAAFRLPGGEEDWTVAQTIGHMATARAGLAVAAARAASGTWPASASPVIPGVPGPADASRDQLIERIAISQKVVVRSARTVAGHETEACPLDHPLVGRLHCGEWLLFAGVHDLMHLAQLHAITDR